MRFPQSVRMRVHWIWKGVYLFGILFNAFFIFLCLIAGQIIPSVFFILLALVFAFTLIMAQSYVEVDDVKVFIHGSPFGNYAISWNEIQAVETNGVGFVFRRGDKALGFNTLLGDGKVPALVDLVEAEIALRNISVERVAATPATMPKNTKIS